MTPASRPTAAAAAGSATGKASGHAPGYEPGNAPGDVSGLGGSDPAAAGSQSCPGRVASPAQLRRSIRRAVALERAAGRGAPLATAVRGAALDEPGTLC